MNIKDLKVGDELVCIDLIAMKKSWELASDAWKSAEIEEIKVSHIANNLVYFHCNAFYLDEYELKFFKKKEQSQYTFDDLIDVAVQANKDRVINGFFVVGEKINCQTLDGEDYNLGIGCEVAHGIEYLQSLYKETFVIESEDDIKRIKLKSEVTLSNNNKFIVDNVSDTFITPNNLFDKLTILSLKGATVEQSK